MKRAFTFIYIALFCAILLVPGVMWISGIQETRKSFENRKLAKLPTFNIARLDPFPVQFDSCFNDHFPIRNSLIYSMNYVEARFYNKSPQPNLVLVGTDGWLYPGGDEFEFVIGQKGISDTMISLIIAELNSRYEECQKLGAEFRVVIVPAKSTLYPEHLPLHYQMGEWENPMQRILRRSTLECKAPILYLLDSLKKHKSEQELYLKTDTHWNDAGAYYGYRSIMNWIYPADAQKKLVPIDFSTCTVSTNLGNLSAMLGLGDYWRDSMRVVKFNQTDLNVYDRYPEDYPCDTVRFNYCWEYELAFQNTDTTLPGLLVIRDSFTNRMMRTMLASHFGRTTYIWDYWQHKLNKEIIQKEKPKVVLCIMNERFLLNFAKYPNNEETSGFNYATPKYW